MKAYGQNSCTMTGLRVLLVMLSVIVLCACQKEGATAPGYIEGNFVYLSSSQSGQLLELAVKRGQWVKKGERLFQIEQQPYRANKDEAQAALEKAAAQLANATAGDRPSELAQTMALIKQAQAELVYANKTVARDSKLINTSTVSLQQFDLAKQNSEVALQQVNNLQQKLLTQKLGQRAELIKAAQAAVAQAQASLASARWHFRQTTVVAPADGQIVDNYFWPGEQVGSQQPVVSLLEPQRMRLIFYVPETVLSRLKIGQSLSFSVDGRQGVTSAVIRFISPDAEYTPPVIYSDKSRQKLVYRIEASLEVGKTAAWHPGQLVTVQLPQADSSSGAA